MVNFHPLGFGRSVPLTSTFSREFLDFRLDGPEDGESRVIVSSVHDQLHARSPNLLTRLLWRRRDGFS